MRIAVGSAFRNSANGQLSRYVRQLLDLRSWAERYGDEVRWIAVEGDSVDGTATAIERAADANRLHCRLVTRNHGGPVFGSTEGRERMKALSYVGNGILEAVAPDDNVLVYVESDLLWSPETIYQLIHQLPKTDVVAPLVFAGPNFYDVWAFRRNGQRFSPFFPYHAELSHDLGALTEVDSVGSCLVMRNEVARNCRIINDEALVGLCADIKAKGYKINVMSGVRVYHP